MLNFPSFFNAQVGGYEIEQSLRFDGSSYLSRTFSSAGNRKTFTVSWWVKRATGNSLTYRDDYMFSAYDGGGSGFQLKFTGTESADGVTEFSNDQGYSGSPSGYSYTNAKYRDESAWYHIVYVADYSNATAADRRRIYFNNERVTSFRLEGTYSDADSSWNYAGVHYVGRYVTTTSYNFHGYMAEVNVIDGQDLLPTDFGEYDDNGVWRPIRYTGTYGTNGFYLKFDPTATNGIGHDHSGNGHNWTPTGFTANSTFPDGDVVYDTPTKNFPVINPVDPAGGTATNFTLSGGNLAANRPGGAGGYTCATFYIPPNTPKFYVELKNRYTTGSQVGVVLGLDGDDDASGGTPQSGFFNNTRRLMYRWNGATTQVPDPPGNLLGANSIVQLAVDIPNGKLWVGVNNTWYQDANTTGGNPSAGTGASDTTLDTTRAYKLRIGSASTPGYANGFWANFGQQDFAYTPPTGFEALNTANLPAPTVKDGGAHFNTVLYTGNNLEQVITGVNFQPDWVWVKCRNQGSTNHVLQDAVRGAQKYLTSDTTVIEGTSNGTIISFDSDGFTIGAGNPAVPVNNNGDTFVAWNWKANGSGSSNTDGSITSTVSANPSAGFSIVTYTGNGTNGATVGHGLGVKPDMVIIKKRVNNTATNTGYWIVQHKQTTAGVNANASTFTLTSYTNGALYLNDTSPLSSYGFDNQVNGNTDTFVAYCFAEVEGYSKFGSYTGNSSTDGPFVFCGFSVQWLMYKRSSAAEDWVIVDNSRDTYNVADAALRPNQALTEFSSTEVLVDFTSNGFKIRSSDAKSNGSGSTYIFMALAENPLGGDGVSPATAR